MLRRSDYDQATRYLTYARDLLADQNFLAKAKVIELLDLCVAHLAAGDQKTGDYVPAEITLLSDIANKVPHPIARTEILKAVAVLRDRSH